MRSSSSLRVSNRAAIRSWSDQCVYSSIPAAGRSLSYRAVHTLSITVRKSPASASDTRSLVSGTDESIGAISEKAACRSGWSLSSTLPLPSSWRERAMRRSSRNSHSSSSQERSNMTSSRRSRFLMHEATLLWAWRSSHIPGCSSRKPFVGTPSLIVAPRMGSPSGSALMIPLRTCSTELLVGAKTATLLPAPMHALMQAARTNWVFPVPGAPQMYESLWVSMPLTAATWLPLGSTPSGNAGATETGSSVGRVRRSP